MPITDTVIPTSTLVDEATITKTGSTISVKDGGIGTTQIATDGVGTAEIVADAITKDELGILTTKGDILTYSTEPARLGAGTNTYLLSALSTETTGLVWVAPPTASPVTVLGTGTVTIATTTATYDVNYADVAVSAGASTDLIVVDIWTEASGNQTVNLNLCINDVTNPATVTAKNLAAGTLCHIRYYLMQMPKANATININQQIMSNAILDLISDAIATGDADVFTTAFTIRLNYKFAVQPSNATCLVAYKVQRIKS